MSQVIEEKLSVKPRKLILNYSTAKQNVCDQSTTEILTSSSVEFTDMDSLEFEMFRYFGKMIMSNHSENTPRRRQLLKNCEQLELIYKSAEMATLTKPVVIKYHVTQGKYLVGHRVSAIPTKKIILSSKSDSKNVDNHVCNDPANIGCWPQIIYTYSTFSENSQPEF
jgi:hypothetical protein